MKSMAYEKRVREGGGGLIQTQNFWAGYSPGLE
jgi:hypothetical protein